MAFVHDGTHPPETPAMHPDESRWFGIAWDDVVPTGAGVASVEWESEAFSIADQAGPFEREIDGTAFAHVTIALISALAVESGNTYPLTATAQLDNGEVVIRTMMVKVRDL